jgi:hypothetical protein
VIRGWLGGALITAGLAFGLTSGPTFGAVAADFHEIFESRCLSCHGHAGEFARTTLIEIDGVLTGIRSGRNIADFLRRHAGGSSPSEITLFVGVFIAQVNSGGFYKERCQICHDRAYDLARLRLIQREGRLVGRYTGRDMASFLPNHARMTAGEADRMLEALTALRMGAR